MLDDRCTLALSAIAAKLWQRLSREQRPLEMVRPVVVPTTFRRVMRAHPLVLERTPMLLLLPGLGRNYELVHATLFGAAMLLTARSDKPLYTTSRRFTNAFVAWAALLGLTVEYDHRLGFGRTSLAVETLDIYSSEAVGFARALQHAQARWTAFGRPGRRPLRS